jgi:hypothetical protein
MNELYYVYLIIDTLTGKMYIGSRKTTIPPEEDLGIKYFSSSTDKDFIQLQKKYPNRFVYTILKTFKSHKDAIKYEAKLHKKHDVADNPMFYNKARQTEDFYVPSREVYERNKKKFKESLHQKGEKNSMFGTMWIKNDKKKLCTRIKKTEKIPKGWVKGRCMEYKSV